MKKSVCFWVFLVFLVSCSAAQSTGTAQDQLNAASQPSTRPASTQPVETCEPCKCPKCTCEVLRIKKDDLGVIRIKSAAKIELTGPMLKIEELNINSTEGMEKFMGWKSQFGNNQKPAEIELTGMASWPHKLKNEQGKVRFFSMKDGLVKYMDLPADLRLIDLFILNDSQVFAFLPEASEQPQAQMPYTQAQKQAYDKVRILNLATGQVSAEAMPLESGISFVAGENRLLLASFKTSFNGRNFDHQYTVMTPDGNGLGAISGGPNLEFRGEDKVVSRRMIDFKKRCWRTEVLNLKAKKKEKAVTFEEKCGD